ncbi:hypothetical protein RFI_19481, partial [Reticulomyxa filosa]
IEISVLVMILLKCLMCVHETYGVNRNQRFSLDTIFGGERNKDKTTVSEMNPKRHSYVADLAQLKVQRTERVMREKALRHQRIGKTVEAMESTEFEKKQTDKHIVETNHGNSGTATLEHPKEYEQHVPSHVQPKDKKHTVKVVSEIISDTEDGNVFQ